MESPAESSQSGGASKPKPALAPKPHLAPKPFSLQKNSTIRSIQAPKTVHATSKAKPDQTGKSEATGGLKPTLTPPAQKPLQTTSTSASKQSSVSVHAKNQPSKALPLREGTPDPGTGVSGPSSPATPVEETPNSESAQKDNVIQTNHKACTDTETNSEPEDKNQEGEARVSEDVSDICSATNSASPSLPGSTRKRLPMELTSKFESSAPPLLPKPSRTGNRYDSKPASSTPEPNQSKPGLSERESDAAGLKEDYTGGGSIKRRISLLFDSSSRPEVTTKREDPEIMNGIRAVKDRIKNWTAETGSEAPKAEKKPPVAPKTKSFEPAAEKATKMPTADIPRTEETPTQPVDSPAKVLPAEEPTETQMETPEDALSEAEASEVAEETSEGQSKAADGNATAVDEGDSGAEPVPKMEKAKRRSVRFGTVVSDDGGPPVILGSDSESSADEEEEETAPEDEPEDHVVPVPVYRRVGILQRRNDEMQRQEEGLKHLELVERQKEEEQHQARLKLEEEQKREEELRLREEETERQRIQEMERRRLKEEEREMEKVREERIRKERQMEQRQKEEDREREEQKQDDWEKEKFKEEEEGKEVILTEERGEEEERLIQEDEEQGLEDKPREEECTEEKTEENCDGFEEMMVEQELELLEQRQEEMLRQVEERREKEQLKEAEERERRRKLQEEEKLRQRQEQEEEERLRREKEEEMERMSQIEKQREEERREEERKRQMEKKRAEALEKKVQEELERREADELKKKMTIEEDGERQGLELTTREEESASDNGEQNLISFEESVQKPEAPFSPSPNICEPTESSVEVVYDDFSVRKPLIQVDYDDFSVKPRKWGSQAKKEAAPVRHSWTEDFMDKEEVLVDLENQENPQEQVLRPTQESPKEGVVEVLDVEEEEEEEEERPEEGEPDSVDVGSEEEDETKTENVERVEKEEDRGEEEDTNEANSYCINEDKETDALTDAEAHQLNGICEETPETDSLKPTPHEVPEDSPDTVDAHKEADLPPLPESFSPRLDTSAQRSKADLGKKLIRSRPSRSRRAGSDQIEQLDWALPDAADEKEESSKQRGVDSEEELPKPPAAQRVPVFPGMSPAALFAQIKMKTGGPVGGGEAEEDKAGEEKESQNEDVAASPSQLSRSPRSGAKLAGAALVLPPLGSNDGGAVSSPAWLKELKSKKRMSQYDGET